MIFLILILSSELITPLFGDELAPTRRSLRTPMFASFLLLNLMNIESLKEIPIKYIIQFLNFLQIIFIFLVIYFLKKKNLGYLILLLVINFFLRLLIKDAVHHPPLNHIFSTLITSVLGINHFAIRFSYLLPFWIFLVAIYQLINPHFNKIPSMIFIVSLSTFPFLTIASVIPDHSLWSTLCFTFLLFYVFLKKNIDYKLCILIISIGILFRITIFTAFILIGLVFIKDLFQKKFTLIEKLNELLLKKKIAIIFLIFAPLLITSISGNVGFEGVSDVNIFRRFIDALKSKIILISLIKQIPYWYYFFIFFIFFIKRRFEFIIFFIVNLIIYFSVQPELWGFAKYSLEYGVPFFLLGLFIFTKLLIDRKKFFLAYILNIVIILFNINDIYRFPESRISGDAIYEKGYELLAKSSNKNTKYLLKNPYNYKDGFKYIKEINAENNTLLLGTTYGFFPEILESYNLNELISIINLKNNFDNFSNSSYSLSKKISNMNNKKTFKDMIKEYVRLMQNSQIIKRSKKDVDKKIINKKDPFLNVNKIKKLKYILLADYGDREQITNTLISQNWILDKSFLQKNYRTTLLLFKKN